MNSSNLYSYGERNYRDVKLTWPYMKNLEDTHPTRENDA